jgi:hypothetical protein
MSKQSSIDWFLNEFSKQIEFAPESELDKWYKELIPKAKAMHKEEIIDAFYEGIEKESNEHGAMYLDKTEAKQYYKETFGGQDNE